jgi:hypothetical protein
MFAHAPCSLVSALIQSASYPRSASSVDPGSNPAKRTEQRRLSCASPGVSPRHRQTNGIHNRVNLAGQSASRTAHVLLTIGGDACAVLVNANDRRVDHLHRCVMSSGEGIHDPSQTPARRQRTKRL